MLSGSDIQSTILLMYKQRYIQYFFVIFVSVIATIIPFCMDSQNGYSENDLDGDKDCWLKGHSQYIFIVAITASLLLHYFVLLAAFMHFRRSKYRKSQIIIIKLCKFVIVYTVIRFFPLIERIHQIFDENVPFWLILLQHVSISALGLSNALVWFWNQKNDKSDQEILVDFVNEWPLTTNTNTKASDVGNYYKRQHFNSTDSITTTQHSTIL